MGNERKEVLENRIKKLQLDLAAQNFEAVLISSVAHIAYLTGYGNFSKEERDAYLFITQKEAFILTHSIYTEVIKSQVKHLTLVEISRREPVRKILVNLLKKSLSPRKVGRNTRLGIEEDHLTVAEYRALQKEFRNIDNFDMSLSRIVKNNLEIENIRKACHLGDEAFLHVIKKIKPGIAELELVFELENYIRKSRADISFKTIVAFGKNSAYPHHQAGLTKFENTPGQIILMDFGVKLNSYCSDMTRTVFFGKPSTKQEKLYETVLEAQKKAVDFINSKIKSGKAIKCAEVDKIARGFITQKGYPSIPHSLGHGIGLEVHEHPTLSPKSKDYLQEGMVFSIEPGIYIPNFGGVRIEDLFVYESNGLIQTTKSSKNLTVI
ncbi:aminopeptidase P family protein [Candidatus Daviesbacteria bacterium]|nr:aminopeptidase P family protein [Candidatus Daviesbacteria bacterium]